MWQSLVSSGFGDVGDAHSVSPTIAPPFATQSTSLLMYPVPQLTEHWKGQGLCQRRKGKGREGKGREREGKRREEKRREGKGRGEKRRGEERRGEERLQCLRSQRSTFKIKTVRSVPWTKRLPSKCVLRYSHPSCMVARLVVWSFGRSPQ